MDLKIGGHLSRYWRTNATFTGSSPLKNEGNPIATFSFRDGGPERKRTYGVRISGDDLENIATLLGDGGDERAFIIREVLNNPDKLNEMKQKVGEISQELSSLREELARKNDQLAKVKAIVMERHTRLLLRIEHLELTVRSTNCLKVAGISDVGQLVHLTERDL